MHLMGFTDYALRTLMYLNQTKETATLGDLAKQLGISRSNLIKVSSRLVKLDYVDATRGPNGGLRITEKTPLIPLGTLIENLEERFHLAECFSDKKSRCTFLKSCALKRSLNQALESFIASLNLQTLDDVTPRI